MAIIVFWVALLVLLYAWACWQIRRGHARRWQQVRMARERALVMPIRGFNQPRERGRFVRDGVPKGLKPWLVRNRGR